jgi:molybdenum cofactor guanylyltransferase
MDACGIILSGGKSSRMGTNKALLKINQKPNIERVKEELEKLVTETVLVSNEPEAYQFLDVHTVSDVYPGQGPLAGIHAGLIASSKDANLVVACDMPFVSVELAGYLIDCIRDYDAVIPIINGKEQPLFAVYRKGISQEIEKCIKNNNLVVMHLLDQLNVRYIKEKELQQHSSISLDKIFFNMNRPEEYEHAKKWAETEE